MKAITNWENANEEVLTNEEQEEKEAVLIDSADENTDDNDTTEVTETEDENSDAVEDDDDSDESDNDSDEDSEDDDTEDDSDEDPVVATSDESEEKPKKGLSRGQSAALIAIGAILALLLIWLFLNALGLFRTGDYSYNDGNNTGTTVITPSGN